MEVFRITLTKYSDKLYATGRINRWNYRGEKLIYTAGSQSLACLENIVHSSGEALNQSFTVMVIYIPDKISPQVIRPDQLVKDWNKHAWSRTCQALGSKWLNGRTSLLLQVPSSIIPEEKNYLINPNHQEFGLVKVIDRQQFTFDKRILGNP